MADHVNKNVEKIAHSSPASRLDLIWLVGRISLEIKYISFCQCAFLPVLFLCVKCRKTCLLMND